MPCDYSLYPQNWKAIRQRILERAGHKCEQCGVLNYAYREKGTDNWTTDPLAAIAETNCTGAQFTRIILTIAHTCNDTRCEDETHLLALCQKHHLQLDAKHHTRNAAKTRFRKNNVNQFSLFEKQP